MTRDNSYEAVMARRQEIMKNAIGIDFQEFESGSISFDYEKMMRETGYSLSEIETIQKETGVGNTPVYELRNLTRLARLYSPKEKELEYLLRTKQLIHLEALKLGVLLHPAIMLKD